MSCACKGSDDGGDGRGERFLVDRRDRSREVWQIARVARCRARPAMWPFVRLTVVAVPLTPRIRGAAHTAHLPGQIIGPDPSGVDKQLGPAFSQHLRAE
jgi:hypothetical protein